MTTSIAAAPIGTVVKVTGDIASVVLRPESAVQALEVELADDSGTMTLVWLGRYNIVGIVPGRRLTVEGRILRQGQLRLMYNPRYELHPRHTDER